MAGLVSLAMIALSRSWLADSRQRMEFRAASSLLSSRAMRLAVCTFVGVLALGAAAPVARACSPLRCSAGSALPADGASVPANLPALFFTPSRDAGGGAYGPPRPDGFELLSADGQPLAVTFAPAPGTYGQSFLAIPAAPLEPGKSYRVRIPQTCNSGRPNPTEQTFTTTAAVPTPSTIGSASTTGQRIEGLTVGTSSGSCTSTITAALARVAIAPSAELRAYLPVAAVTATVDGSPAPVVNFHPPVGAGPIELDVYGACAGNDPGAARGLAPGRYQLQIDAHVVGATQDPLPIWTEIELRCDGSGRESPLTPGGGCSLSGSRAAPRWWLVGVGVMVLARRRRRSRRLAVHRRAVTAPFCLCVAVAAVAGCGGGTPPAVSTDPGWRVPPAALPAVTDCPSPRLDPAVALLDGASVLTGVAGLGDRWALSWMDRRGVTTAKLGTVGLDGKTIATRVLGSPALEPRVAAAGTYLGVVWLSAADPSRRDLPFAVFTADLEPAGGNRTIAPAGGVDASRLALAWNGVDFAVFPGTRELFLLGPDGTMATASAGPGTLLGGHAVVGAPGGFAFAVHDGGKTVVRSLSAADGTTATRFELLAGSASLALAPDPASGQAVGALAGENVQLVEPDGRTSAVSDVVGSVEPQIDIVALGAAGGARTAVVAWTGPALGGTLYHVTGVSSAQRPYFKTESGGSRIWAAAAGDSVGIFVTSGTGGGPGGTAYFRLRCR